MKVIKLNNTSFNKERFKKFEQKQKCEHKKGLTFDDDENFVECDTCSHKFTLPEFMIWWIRNLGDSKLEIEMYNIKNSIYFLNQQKQDLEDKIKYLKKEKTALVKEVNKLTKSI